MSDTPIADPELADLAQRFAAHAAIYAGATADNASPLYAQLAQQIAGDPAVLDLVRHADRATQVSNLLFGAVHFLLLQNTDTSLAAFYASLVPDPQPPAAAYPAFRAFCLAHADAVRELVTTRRVQTNEVGRCANLLPAFALVEQSAGGRPLALVEIGASAGLNLLWDRYGYDYGPACQAGDEQAPVQLRCLVEGALRPPIPQQLPVVAARVGIDLHPVSLDDADAVRWLRALIWPEQRARAALFEQALVEACRNPPTVLAGDAAALLPAAVARLPADALVCVYHSYTLNQCPTDVRAAIEEQCATIARQRALVRVALEWYGGQPTPELALIDYTDGSARRTLLARCESHGRTMRWLDQATAASGEASHV